VTNHGTTPVQNDKNCKKECGYIDRKARPRRLALDRLGISYCFLNEFNCTHEAFICVVVLL
jgi:hypothetical protein